MQKIAQNVGSSIDSLNAKILLMQNELSSLKVQNKGISDSLKTLNETLKTADIKTSFYDTHLATYTVIFSVIVAVILTLAALINWFGIIKPLEKKFNKLVEALQRNLDDFKENHIDEIINDLRAASARTLQTIAINYEDTNPDISFLFSIRLLKLYSNWDNVNQDTYKLWIDYSGEFLNECKFRPEDFEQMDEIIESLQEVYNKLENVESKSKVRKLLLEYSSKMNEVKKQFESQTSMQFNDPEDSTSPNSSSPKADDE